jgi:cytochrome c5
VSSEPKYLVPSVVAALAVFVLAMLIVAALDNGPAPADMSDEAVARRIAPVGRLNTGEPIPATSPEAEIAAKPVEPAARDGEAVYNAACVACHATGAAGAPRLGDAAAWAARADKGLETLVKNAITGIRAMPPRGTCGSCTDAELQRAVEYMLERSR